MTPPEYQHLDRAIIAQIKIEGKCTPFEKEYIRKDGSRVWVLIGGAHFQGCTDKGSFFVLDISDRKQAQNQIRENEARIAHQLAELNLVYNTAPVGLSFVDTHLRYVRMNEYLAAINGRSIADHIGRTVREAIPELADLVEPIYQQVLATQTPVLDWEVKAETLQQPGVLRDWLVSFYPVCDESGTLLGVSNVVADISDRKQAEAERAQLLDRERAARAEAEAINRLKDEFFSNSFPRTAHAFKCDYGVVAGAARSQVHRRNFSLRFGSNRSSGKGTNAASRRFAGRFADYSRQALSQKRLVQHRKGDRICCEFSRFRSPNKVCNCQLRI